LSHSTSELLTAAVVRLSCPTITPYSALVAKLLPAGHVAPSPILLHSTQLHPSLLYAAPLSLELAPRIRAPATHLFPLAVAAPSPAGLSTSY